LTGQFGVSILENGKGWDMAEQERSRWEQQLRDAARHVEEDLRRVVTYINDEVVPDVRQNGSEALRSAARELEKLAQKMDDRRTASTGATPPPREK
jgi:hypothetical protein